MNVREYLEKVEGRKNKPYIDTEGYPTVGIGHKLAKNFYPDDEVDRLFIEDLGPIVTVLSRLPYWDSLTDARQCVLISLCLNVGISGFRAFRRMRAALDRRDFDTAAEELKDSKRHRQIGRRGDLEYQMMKSGEWPDEPL